MGVLSALPPATVGWLLIMAGCCANVFSLEVIAQRDKGAGHLITFAQFAFIAVEGFLGQFDFRTRRLSPRVIPLSTYALMTSLFLLSSVLNNIALNFNISIPVHTVFRSAGLAGTLLTGFFFFGKRYSVQQVVSCTLVCIGIISLTLADAHVRKLPDCCGAVAGLPHLPAALAAEGDVPSSWRTSVSSAFASLSLSSLFGGDVSTSLFEDWDLRWALGIGMLASTLAMLAVLGHIQDKTYAKHGKVWREVMFMTHAVALPFFLFVAPDIWTHAVSWIDSATYARVTLPGGHEFVASLFVFLLINLVTQSICFKGVAILTSHTSALTCTIALTLRKFISLVLSIWWFQNPFTTGHQIGATLVFAGIVLYASPMGKPQQQQQQSLNAQSTIERSPQPTANGKATEASFEWPQPQEPDSSSSPALRSTSPSDAEGDFVLVRRRQPNAEPPATSESPRASTKKAATRSGSAKKL